MDPIDIIRALVAGLDELPEKAPESRIDMVDGLPVKWENGVDIRVGIPLLREMQRLVKKA